MSLCLGDAPTLISPICILHLDKSSFSILVRYNLFQKTFSELFYVLSAPY